MLFQSSKPVDLQICESCLPRHGHKNLSKDYGMLHKWWGDSIMYGTKDWELINALEPKENDAILGKKRYNAFHGTGLDESLKSIKVEELIITGVLTNCCCETTARDAFIRDYRVFLLEMQPQRLMMSCTWRL